MKKRRRSSRQTVVRVFKFSLAIKRFPKRKISSKILKCNETIDSLR